jgi:pimeloyl-ACP methyl ester carboxylesterase
MQGGGRSGDAARVWVSTQVGGRVSVCVSGLGGGTDEWRDVGPALARYGDVIAVELTPGSASMIQSGSGPLQMAVESLERVLAGESERPVLMGHSMGALASMLIAATQSDRLAGLVLTAPFVPAARNGRSRLVTTADYARHRVLFLTGARRRRRRRVGPRAVSRRARVAALGALAQYGLQPGAFHAMADRVACPVLVVHGADDHYVPPAFVLAAAARHPTWQVALIAGAGHFPHRDDPAAWLGTVDPWLQRLHPR